ncbi:MAG: MCP four helix bundle domain-containing protein [Alphaproteobacteria bacterium]|nr:MCP four helix bundle domain-containing protein [Alphaproteobacteria bacterium]
MHLKLGITGRLAVLVASLLAILAISGAVGILSARRAAQGLETVYLDRVVPLRDLKDIADAYAVSIVDTAHKVRGGSLSATAGVESVDKASSLIRGKMASYLATFLVERERKLVSELAPLMRDADASVEALRGILLRADQRALAEFAERRLYPAIDPVSEKIGQLVELQLDVARTEFEASEAAARWMLWVTVALLALGLGGGSALAWAVARSVAQPVLGMTRTMQALAAGELGIAVPGTERQDEVGGMARSVEVFKRGLAEAQRLRSEQDAAKQRAEQERRDMLQRLAESFERDVGGIVQAVTAAATQLQGTASALSAASERTSHQTASAASASEQANANVQTVATAAQELSASSNEISRQMTTASDAAARAREAAQSANAVIDSLSGAAGRIGDVVKLINQIAGQTNLLALNATIEAARAGEAGRGFAVVASEVKSLAGQTAKATDEIQAQIGSIQEETRKAVGMIAHVTGTVQEITSVTASVASAVEEQGAATAEIARNVQEAAQGTGTVSANVASVQQAAKETGAAASQVLAAAQALAAQSDALSGQVGTFVRTVRQG